VGKNYSGKKNNTHASYTISKETAKKYIGAWRQREEAARKKRGEYVEGI
jgi:hypothetical protein